MKNKDLNHDRYLPTRRSLLSRLRDLNDDPSWQDFFDTYWKLIYNTAIRAGLSDADAQDVVQETVITVTRKIGDFRYDPQKSFKGWLLTTTNWKIQDQRRRRQRDRVLNPLPPDDASEHPDFKPLEVPRDDLVEYWDEAFPQTLVDAAIGRIKKRVRPRQFQLFELFVLKEWPMDRITTTLGVSTSQVYVAKHRVSELIKGEVERLQTSGH